VPPEKTKATDEDSLGFDEMESEEEDEDVERAPKLFNDASEYLKSFCGDPTEVLRSMSKINLTKEQIQSIMEDQNHHYHRLLSIVNNYYTKRSYYELRSLKKLFKDQVELSTGEDQAEIKDSVTHGPGNIGKSLEGDEAVITTIARLEGVRKVKLINSGFFIKLRKPSNDELRNIMTYVDTERKEMGKLLGGYYYTVDDVLFVEALMEMLPHLVVGSNLKKWRHGHNLAKAIKYTDLDTIVGGLIALLHPDGFYMEMYCPDEQCKHSEKIKVSVDLMRIINKSKLTDVNWKILLSPAEFGLKEYKEYNEALGLDGKIELTPNLHIHTKVPTIFSFVRFGKKFIADMTSALHRNDAGEGSSSTDDEILTYKHINFYRMFLPWIEKISFYKDGDYDYDTKTPEAIIKVLEADIWEQHPKKTKEFIEYFDNCRLVRHAYVGEKCPSCGKEPLPATNNRVPFDVTDFFFNLSYLRLTTIVS
jgi:hypothetical protein